MKAPMNFFIILTFWVLLFSHNCHSEQQPAFNITFTGDVILDRGVSDELRLHGDSILVNSLKQFSEQDYFVINYEGTFTQSDAGQIDKINFKADGRLASMLRSGGVTHASLANNHSFDYGAEGFQSTQAALTENNITPLGISANPVILGKDACQCAILSASITSHNEELPISSIDLLKQSVDRFVASNPAIPLILYLHWGLEMQPEPEEWQRELARDLVQSGVDAIIGHHPHVVQTVEYIDNVPIFYSIGNFVADAYLPLTDESIVVNFKIADEIVDVSFALVNLTSYLPESVKPAEQMMSLQHVLQHSPNVAILDFGQYWQMRRAGNVDFSENTKLWLFSAEDFIVAVEGLIDGGKVLSVLQSEGFSNFICLDGKLSEIRVADIDNDGTEDIIAGLTKSVHFDPEDKKRVNIFSCRDGDLQPLWLGTKFIYNVVSFDVCRLEGENYLCTVESDSLGNTYNGMYEWDYFGFALKEMKSANKIGGLESESCEI